MDDVPCCKHRKANGPVAPKPVKAPIVSVSLTNLGPQSPWRMRFSPSVGCVTVQSFLSGRFPVTYFPLMRETVRFRKDESRTGAARNVCAMLAVQAQEATHYYRTILHTDITLYYTLLSHYTISTSVDVFLKVNVTPDASKS